MIRLDWSKDDVIEKSRAAFASHQPFPLFRVDDFVNDSSSLARIQDELMEESFYEKNNDLYNFHQSDDLAGTESRTLAEFIQQLYGDEFRAALTAVSGIQLNSNIDVTSSLYRRHDHLLPHDDQLLGRRIAFILYLVPDDWSEQDGGHLDLFSVDSAGEPDAVCARILPRRNSLVFFEVSNASYHQVAEVLSDKHRLSINGCLAFSRSENSLGNPFRRDLTGVRFHGVEEKPMRAPTCLNAPSADTLYEQQLRVTKFDIAAESSLTETDMLLLQQWISPSYLKKQVQRQICNQFESESEIELRDFLSKPQWDRLQAAVSGTCAKWSVVGPFNKRRFEVLDRNSGSENVFEEVCSLFESQAMMKLLQILSGSYYRIMSATTLVREFSPGCYTLAYDDDPEAQRASLDVSFAFTTVGEDVESGATVYVDEEAEKPLCVVTPSANSLTMVLRAEPGTMRFVKFVNSNADTRIDIDVICAIDEPEQ